MSTLESAQLIIVTSQVAIKFMNPDQNLIKHCNKLRRKIKIWGRLQNEHILPLLGLCHGYGTLPGLVSPWVDNGSLTDFLYGPHTTLTRYECFRLVSYLGFEQTHNSPVFS
jgi:serine/threonine protein kinase